jgi:hypothetical protein
MLQLENPLPGREADSTIIILFNQIVDDFAQGI